MQFCKVDPFYEWNFRVNFKSHHISGHKENRFLFLERIVLLIFQTGENENGNLS